MQRWQLACERDIAHIVVMPNVTEHKVDLFVKELQQCIETHGAQQVLSDDSPLAQLSSSAWGSDMDKNVTAIHNNSGRRTADGSY